MATQTAQKTKTQIPDPGFLLTPAELSERLARISHNEWEKNRNWRWKKAAFSGITALSKRS